MCALKKHSAFRPRIPLVGHFRVIPSTVSPCLAVTGSASSRAGKCCVGSWEGSGARSWPQVPLVRPLGLDGERGARPGQPQAGGLRR